VDVSYGDVIFNESLVLKYSTIFVNSNGSFVVLGCITLDNVTVNLGNIQSGQKISIVNSSCDVNPTFTFTNNTCVNIDKYFTNEEVFVIATACSSASSTSIPVWAYGIIGGVIFIALVIVVVVFAVPSVRRKILPFYSRSRFVANA